MKALRSLITILTAFIALSCSRENTETPQHEDDLTAFSVNAIFGTIPKPQTKIPQTTSESKISEISVLVFENDVYAYSAQGTSVVSGTDNQTDFKAKIKTSASPLKLYFVANVNSELEAANFQAGASIETVKNGLNKVFTTLGLHLNFPMWGVLELPTGMQNGGNYSGIKMLRAIAAADVIVSSNANFNINSAQIYRAANMLQIIPNNPSTVPDVSDVSIPVDVAYNVITNPVLPQNGNIVSMLYMPESAAPSDVTNNATCIVIGGYYKGSSTLSYYRLDFAPKAGGHPVGQILRNHRYEFIVSAIEEEGYATASDAANNPSKGINATIIAWDSQIKYMVFNDDNYLGVSEIQFTIGGVVGPKLTFPAECDGDYTMAWCDRNGNLTSAEAQSISDDTISVKKVGALVEIEVLKAIIGNDSRICYFALQIGKLKIKITVSQLPDLFIPGGIQWATGNVDVPGTFAQIGQQGKLYQWGRMVDWPVTGPVAGWDTEGSNDFTWEIANDPCPAGWRIPSKSELESLLSVNLGRTWRDKHDGYQVPGVWLGPSQANTDAASIENTGGCLFFPTAGGRNSNGEAYNTNSNGYYWSANLDTQKPSWISAVNPYYLSVAHGTYQIFPATSTAEANSIRCIKIVE